ncbi:MAG: hypothetical protein JNK26_02335 [Candidatus Doudnabacteria bacterium]|nr:hypothetical protein [Candidatus Doudnabacteria bacterium]
MIITDAENQLGVSFLTDKNTLPWPQWSQLSKNPFTSSGKQDIPSSLMVDNLDAITPEELQAYRAGALYYHEIFETIKTQVENCSLGNKNEYILIFGSIGAVFNLLSEQLGLKDLEKTKWLIGQLIDSELNNPQLLNLKQLQRISTLSRLVANYISINIYSNFPVNTFCSLTTKVLSGEGILALGRPKLRAKRLQTENLPKTTRDWLRTLGEAPPLITMEAAQATALDSSTLAVIGRSRQEQFGGKQGWLLPKPPSVILQRLEDSASVDLDLDASDMNPETEIYTFSFHSHPQEATVRTKYPGSARLINLVNTTDLPIRNGTLEEVLRNLRFSPFDVNGNGPHIDTDIRAAIRADKASIVELLRQEGIQDINESNLVNALEDADIVVSDAEVYPSTTDIVLNHLLHQIDNIPLHSETAPILEQFLERLNEKRTIILLERLIAPVLVDSNGEPVKNFLTSMAALAVSMWEMATDCLAADNTLWLIQCDDKFTGMLETMFGKECFYHFNNANAVGGVNGIMQLKVNRKTGKVEKDACNTMLIDIKKALFRFMADNQDSPNYEASQYILSQLPTDVRAKLEAEFSQSTKLEA